MAAPWRTLNECTVIKVVAFLERDSPPSTRVPADDDSPRSITSLRRDHTAALRGVVSETFDRCIAPHIGPSSRQLLDTVSIYLHDAWKRPPIVLSLSLSLSCLFACRNCSRRASAVWRESSPACHRDRTSSACSGGGHVSPLRDA